VGRIPTYSKYRFIKIVKISTKPNNSNGVIWKGIRKLMEKMGDRRTMKNNFGITIMIHESRNSSGPHPNPNSMRYF
jgi:hypothetical protein